MSKNIRQAYALESSNFANLEYPLLGENLNPLLSIEISSCSALLCQYYI